MERQIRRSILRMLAPIFGLEWIPALIPYKWKWLHAMGLVAWHWSNRKNKQREKRYSKIYHDELLLVPITLPQFSVYSINLAQLSKIIPGGQKCPEIVVRLLGLQACIEGIYQLPYSGIPKFFSFLAIPGQKGPDYYIGCLDGDHGVFCPPSLRCIIGNRYEVHKKREMGDPRWDNLHAGRAYSLE